MPQRDETNNNDENQETRLLLATVLIDRRNHRNARQLGKTFVSSLLRFFFNGDVVIWRNFEEPLYLIGRNSLYEFPIEIEAVMKKDDDLARVCQGWRLKQAESLVPESPGYGWVILSDMDVLCLRNLDHLFENQSRDVLIHRTRAGEIDPGFFAVRGSRFQTFVETWKSLAADPATEGGGLIGKAIEVAGLTHRAFERGEVVCLFEEGTLFQDVLDAAVVRLAGVGGMADKAKTAFALHMMRALGDKDGVFLDLMEN